MPDAYELAHDLSPTDPADPALLAANGYSNLENYLNGLVASTVLATTKASSSTGLLHVFPNPALAGQALTVAYPPQVGAAGRLTVYSFDGRLVAHSTALPGTSQTQLDVSRLAPGQYTTMKTALAHT